VYLRRADNGEEWHAGGEPLQAKRPHPSNPREACGKTIKSAGMNRRYTGQFKGGPIFYASEKAKCPLEGALSAKREKAARDTSGTAVRRWNQRGGEIKTKRQHVIKGKGSLCRITMRAYRGMRGQTKRNGKKVRVASIGRNPAQLWLGREM